MKKPKAPSAHPNARFNIGDKVLVFNGTKPSIEATITSREYLSDGILAGWVYSHNGGLPNYGESMYTPAPKD